ncbi:MAG: J domain-containing protein [Chlamydiales bacterium]
MCTFIYNIQTPGHFGYNDLKGGYRLDPAFIHKARFVQQYAIRQLMMYHLMAELLPWVLLAAEQSSRPSIPNQPYIHNYLPKQPPVFTWKHKPIPTEWKTNQAFKNRSYFTVPKPKAQPQNTPPSAAPLPPKVNVEQESSPFAAEFNFIKKHLPAGSKEPVEKDPYSHLGLENNASVDEVRQRYKKLARALHPDKVSEEDCKAATAAFRIVKEAHDQIVNAKK